MRQLLAAAMMLALVSTPSAVVRPRVAMSTTYINLGINHVGSYDYVPSVLWDAESQVWRAWWCGYDGQKPGDAIYYATSANGTTGWSAPTRVVRPSASGWDSQHACDPTVLMRPPGTFSAYKFVLWYTGNAVSDGAFNAKIGVATSNNGVTWTKYAGNPIIDCAALASYGCGQTSFAIVDGAIKGVMSRVDGVTNQLSALTSTDGVTFTEAVWPLPFAGVPGVDVMVTAAGAWYGVYTGDSTEHAIKAPGFGQLFQPAGDADPTIRSWGAGWYRTGGGGYPGFFRTAMGTPSLADVSHDVWLQELRAMDWQGLP